MREVLTELAYWWRRGEPVGLATVVGAWRSAPRPPGAALLVGPDGSAVGSVYAYDGTPTALPARAEAYTPPGRSGI
ncbi:XdhC family protein [Micromonosporaceae bacterium B7E4]